jgi:hypothetical protein
MMFFVQRRVEGRQAGKQSKQGQTYKRSITGVGIMITSRTVESASS